jgi:tetratricopeptide (TPR) repeat protein
VERIAILRFENLGADPANDWMGRAFSEILTSELGDAKGLYAVSAGRIHAVENGMGGRPPEAPGISAERTAALEAGATEVVFGQYSVRNGTLTARMTLEDELTGRMTVLPAISVPAGDVISAASELAREISNQSKPYSTKNPLVVEAHVKAFEHSASPEIAADLEKAIAADPNFGPSYRQLAEVQAQQKDIPGAQATLARGIARGDRIPPMERALMQIQDANLRNDAALRLKGLAALSAADTGDPDVWQNLGLANVASHLYPQAVEAFKKAAALQPGDGNLWNQLGYAAVYAGDTATATDAIEHYRRLAPTAPNPLDSLADIDFIAGQLPQAEATYRENAKKYPDFFGGLDFLKAAITRLMSGDVSGADAIAQQYFDARATAKDPVLDYRKAQWAWISGRRQAACQQMEKLTAITDNPAARNIASHAAAELAMWNLMLGNRQRTATLAHQAADLARPAVSPEAAIAAFLSQSPASAAEWQARVKALLPNPAQEPVADLALVDALLFAKDYGEALPVLKSMYDSGNSSAGEGLPVLLAWAYVETGHIPEAAELLRFNPPLADSGITWATSLYFPRIFYLRAVVAEKQGKPDIARENWRIFHAVSGPDPLFWGEEQQGK